MGEENSRDDGGNVFEEGPYIFSKPIDEMRGDDSLNLAVEIFLKAERQINELDFTIHVGNDNSFSLFDIGSKDGKDWRELIIHQIKAIQEARKDE